MIRDVDVGAIRALVQEMIETSVYRLPDDYLRALERAREREPSASGRAILLMLQDNAALAVKETVIYSKLLANIARHLASRLRKRNAEVLDSHL